MTEGKRAVREKFACFGVLMLAILAVFLSPVKARASAGLPPDLSYSVLRDGREIGRHDVRFTRDGDQMVVSVDVDIRVKLGFITVFSYSHRSEERWQSGRFLQLTSETRENGHDYAVEAVLNDTGDHFEVITVSGRTEVPADDILPASYWRRDMLEAPLLLNVKTGAIEASEAMAEGEEVIETPWGERQALRYRIPGEHEALTWYDTETGLLAGLQIEAAGAPVIYRRNIDIQLSQVLHQAHQMD